MGSVGKREVHFHPIGTATGWQPALLSPGMRAPRTHEAPGALSSVPATAWWRKPATPCCHTRLEAG